MEADGLLDEATRGGDAFPGEAGVTLCSLKAWDGSQVIAIRDISLEEDGEVRFNVVSDGTIVPAPTALRANDVSYDSLVLEWEDESSAEYYIINVTDVEGNSPEGWHDHEVTGTTKIRIAPLSPDTDYTLSVAAGVRNYRSEPVDISVTTLVLPFELRMPECVEVNVDTETPSVSWNAVADATGYLVDLRRMEYDKENTETICGFDSRGESLPEGWTLEGDSFYSVNGWYGEAKPSVKFSSAQHSLRVKPQDCLISGIRFWSRAKGEAGKLILQLPDEDVNVEVSTEGSIQTIPVGDIESFTLVHAGEGPFVVIDDITLLCHLLLRVPEATLNVSETTVPLANLVAGQRYSLLVTALRGDERSKASEEIVFTAGSSGIHEVAIPRGAPTYYDLHGNRVANPCKGLYIVVREGRAYKEFIR